MAVRRRAIDLRRVKSLASGCFEFSTKVLACSARLLPVDLAYWKLPTFSCLRWRPSSHCAACLRRSDRVFQWRARGAVGAEQQSMSHLEATICGSGRMERSAAGPQAAWASAPRERQQVQEAMKCDPEGLQAMQ